MWTGSFSSRDVKSGTKSSTEARKPFMSQRAAAVKLAVSELEFERIARPGLALHRNAVAVAGEADTAFARRSDGRKQLAFAPSAEGNQRRSDAKPSR